MISAKIAKEALIRFGTAVSFHEFEIALGSNLKDLLVADGDAEEMRSLYPLSIKEKLLQQYFVEKNIDQPLAFTNQIFNLIFQKKSQSALMNRPLIKVNNIANVGVRFKPNLIEKDPPSVKQIALLVTTEYEGIFRNGEIDTYYRAPNERLAAEDFYIILLLCQSQEAVAGKSTIPALKHIFSTSECRDVLELQPTHLAPLSQLHRQGCFRC